MILLRGKNGLYKFELCFVVYYCIGKIRLHIQFTNENKHTILYSWGVKTFVGPLGCHLQLQHYVVQRLAPYCAVGASVSYLGLVPL